MEKLEKVPVPQFIWAVNQATKALEAQGKQINWSPMPNEYYTSDPLHGGFSPASLKIPTMVGTVIAEFGEVQDYGERSQLPVEEQERLVKEYYGEEGGQKILDAFRKVYPNTPVIYATDLENFFLADTVEYVKKKGRGGQRSRLQLHVRQDLRLRRRPGSLALRGYPLFLPQRTAHPHLPPAGLGRAGAGHVRGLCELRQDR